MLAGYTCTCVDGYEGDDCETETNECVPNPCQHAGVCTVCVDAHFRHYISSVRTQLLLLVWCVTTLIKHRTWSMATPVPVVSATQELTALKLLTTVIPILVRTVAPAL